MRFNETRCRRRLSVPAAILFILCLLLLTGCGRSLVLTTGFGRNEVFRIGSKGCKIAEIRVYMLDLQKENVKLFGNALWEGEESAAMQDAVREQALAQSIRVKTLNRIGVSRNVMLTTQEERLAEEAEHNYYAALSDAEKKYLGLDEKNLQRMFREYALAEKTWRSLGEDAEKAYDEYLAGMQCDLNTALWQKVSLKQVEGEPEAPGFAQCYREIFASEAQEESAGGAASTGSTAEEAASKETAAEETAAEESAAEQTNPDAAAPEEQAPAETKKDAAAEQKETEAEAPAAQEKEPAAETSVEKEETPAVPEEQTPAKTQNTPADREPAGGKTP